MSTDWSTDQPTAWPADSRPVRLALIGAGVFARDAHLPSLLRRPDHFEIAAVYSRSTESAQALAQAIPYPVAQYTDLDALLARPDIEAVDIVLPIAAMPAIVAQALAAGKHVLSEKPIAPTVAAGRALLAQSAHRSQPQGLLPVWMVGENWRYEEAFRRAAQLVHEGTIGSVVTCSWAVHSPMTPSSKYYHTAWRRDSSIPGGLLLDGGVHHAAILRLILGEIVEVRARPPPPGHLEREPALCLRRAGELPGHLCDRRALARHAIHCRDLRRTARAARPHRDHPRRKHGEHRLHRLRRRGKGTARLCCGHSHRRAPSQHTRRSPRRPSRHRSHADSRVHR
jgi:predicted dehydrogenase